MNLHMAVNGCFLLNPENKANSATATLTPVEIVKARQPKRLLVNIGINDGIWTVCLEATDAKLDTKSISDQLVQLATPLLDLRTSGAVDRIYFNLLPKPSAVANVMPPRNPPACPPTGGYYPRYVGRLGQEGGLTGQQLSDVDARIAGLNAEIRTRLGAMFAAAGGLAFVDIFAAMADQDDKHCREAEPVRVNHGRAKWHLTNKPLQSVAALGGFVSGGLFGLDNLHPTAVGYSVLARAVCAEFASTEGIPVTRPIDFQETFDADTLLQNLPGALDFEDFLLDVALAFVS
jgi:lysophospholipase L1-like esterase